MKTTDQGDFENLGLNKVNMGEDTAGAVDKNIVGDVDMERGSNIVPGRGPDEIGVQDVLNQFRASLRALPRKDLEILTQELAWEHNTMGVGVGSPGGDLRQHLSVSLENLKTLTKRFDSKGVKKSDLSEDRQQTRIMEGLKARNLGRFIPGPSEESLEDYVDVLASIHKGSDVTSAVIKRQFLSSAVIAAETREKLSQVADLDDMFDMLAKIQYPHPGYCQALEVRISVDTDRQSTVAETVEYARNLIVRQSR